MRYSERDFESEAGNLLRDIEFLEEARRRRPIPNDKLEESLAQKQQTLTQIAERLDDLTEEDER